MNADITSSVENTIQANQLPTTLADVRARVADDEAISRSRRRDIIWAIDALALRSHRPPSTLPAELVVVNSLVAELRRAPQGLTSGTIANLGHHVRFALQRYAAPEVTAVPSTSPSKEVCPIWSPLIAKAGGGLTALPLKRFAAWCTTQQIAPNDVTAATVEAYAKMGTGSLKHPRQHLAKLRSVWNRAASSVPGWPQIKLDPPPRAQPLSVAWQDLHPCLREHLDAYFAARERTASARPALRDHAVPRLKASSADKSRANVRLFLGALRDLSVDVGEINSPVDLLEPERVADGLERISQRSRCATGTGASNVAGTLAALARHFSPDLPDGWAARIADYRARLAPRIDGMVEAKRARLLPFRDRATRARLLGLPFALADEAERRGGLRGARLMAVAVAIELLLVTVMRRGNVVRLRLGEDVIFTGAGRARRTHIVVAGDKVKNEEPRLVELPESSAALLGVYLRDWRPLLPSSGGPFVFPGERDDSACNSDAFGHVISRTILDRLGLQLTAHDFRSIAVFLHLDHAPGDFATLMQILGHRRLETTLRHYAWLDGEKAYRAFHDFLLHDRRTFAPLRLPRRASRSAKGAPHA